MKVLSKLRILMISALFLLSAGLFMSCRKPSTFETASMLFDAERYEEAEECFLAALSEEGSTPIPTVHLAHAYNLIALKDYSSAKAELEAIYKDTEGATVGNTLRLLKSSARALADIAEEAESYSEALTYLNALTEAEKNPAKSDELKYETAVVCEKLYRGDAGNFDKWVDSVNTVLSGDAYAPELFVNLYGEYKSRLMRKEALETADRFIVYADSRSFYAEDFAYVISVMFDAAKIAQHEGKEYNPEKYYEAAERFIGLAEARGLEDDELLKYQIIIAERKEKWDAARSLLVVYLNHKPDDAAALKEKEYLEYLLDTEE